MHDDDLHLSQIQTAWSMVRQAHGDDTAVHAAQQSLLDRYGGAVRRYALASLRDEDAADEVSQEFALRFVRGTQGSFLENGHSTREGAGRATGHFRQSLSTRRKDAGGGHGPLCFSDGRDRSLQ